MFKSLETYLGMCASPEQSTMILSACHALLDAGYSDHASVLEQELAIADNIPDDLVLGMTNGYLIPVMRRALGEFGITTINDVTLPMLTSILQAVMQLDNWSDTDALLDAMALDLEPVEIMGDVLAITGAHSALDYMAVLESVSDDLIIRLRQVTEKTADNQNAVTIRSPEMVEQYNRTHARVVALCGLLRPEQYSLMTEYLEEGGKLLMPVKLLDGYYDRLHEYVQPLDAAYQILALVATTQLETIHLGTLTMRLLEQLQFDDIQVGGCATAIRELVAKLSA